MLTVDFDRLGLQAGDRVLDMGAGAGRHSFEMYRRGADVIAFDLGTVEPSLAGPRRPEDRVPLSQVPVDFDAALARMRSAPAQAQSPAQAPAPEIGRAHV